MKRSRFIQIGTGSMASFLVPLPRFVKSVLKAPDGPSASDFLKPPDSSKPFTWWHWMNGNVTTDGITRDLEFMQKAGIGGFQLFQVGTGIPKGPVNFGSDQWLQLLQHAAREADRLGLEYDMMNGGGWSSSGGPWITPELSMQQLTWSELQVAGGKQLQVSLPKPYQKLGFYRDAFVLAFPTPGGGIPYSADSIKKAASSNGPVDARAIIEGKWPEGVDITSPDPDKPVYVQLEFGQSFKAQSVMIYGTGLHRDGPGRPIGPNGFPHTITVEASDDGDNFRALCELEPPHMREESLEVPAVANFAETDARFFRLRFPGPFKLCYLRLLPSQCVADWPLKANFTRLGAVKAGDMLPTGAGVPASSVVDPRSVIDLAGHMDSDGKLDWDAPEGNWTILRMGHTSVGVQNHPSPDGGGGLECDKYSRKAYAFHFEQFFGKLLPFLESLGKQARSGAIIDSYEVGMQTWTENFPKEFSARRGYSFAPYLPALVGYAVGGGEITDRFLWDIRRTEADMMGDHYFGYFAELCHAHHMKSYTEPYSGGPFDEFQSGAHMDVPMGEFWAGMDGSNSVYYSVKLASSIAHIYGKRVVAAESYTGMPTQTKWQMYPYALKGQGDWMYTLGLNKFIFHVYAMQPHPTAKPGMTMGPWGWMHSRNNTWADEEQDWLRYVQRTQYLLQEGQTVADLVYYVGEEVPVNTPVLPFQLHPMPPAGYYYDVSDAQGIVTRMKVDQGRILLPDGMSYRLLILPESKVLSLDLLRKISSLVQDGMQLYGPKPVRTPGLADHEAQDKELRQLADAIWGDLDGSTRTSRTFGKGRVFWVMPLEQVLQTLGVSPDFTFTSKSGDAPINFIHLRADGKDLYFIANRRRQPEDLVCTFRIDGKSPEFWNPETGEITSTAVYTAQEGRTRIPIHLDPASSLFVAFQLPATGSGLESISKDGEPVATTTPFPASKGKYAGTKDNFTVSVWLKPDAEISLPGNGSWISHFVSFAFFPGSGSKIYGEGHVTAGLTAGRNGVVVFESSETPVNVLTIDQPLSGWTHVALTYREGVPSVYLNGILSGQGTKSTAIVHPGLGVALQEEGANYFHGDLGDLQLFTSPLDPARIKKIYLAGIPRPIAPALLESAGDHASQKLLFRENGLYTLRDQGGRETSLQITELPKPLEITGSWEVSFPAGLGAPEKIHLTKLISLKDHPEDGVKYFSGTASYQKTIQIPASFLSGNKKVYLDLGWVEVIAQVTLNGKNAGTAWKAPYRVDLTGAAVAGNNTLEIKVTTLWPNRLIGDEHLPAENDYGKGEKVPLGAFGEEINKLPDWYVEGKPKPPGGRITFTTWRHYEKDDPLLESGLLGPVSLQSAVVKSLEVQSLKQF